MKERPILFSGPMVRALLAGTKTQTRRIMSVQPDEHATVIVESYDPTVIDRHGDEQPGAEIFGAWWADGACGLRCPYGQPGDRLWVRETWRIGAWDENQGAFAIDYCDGPRREWLTDPTDDYGERFESLWVQCSDELRAKGVEPDKDGRYHWESGESPLRWRPSIHMPRWASRITLEITGVRVERLQEISEADAQAEGVYTDPACPAYDAYQTLWEQINGPGSWAANLWVWVVEFKMAKP